MIGQLRRQGFNRQAEGNMDGIDGSQRSNGVQASSPMTSSPTVSNFTPSHSFASANGPSNENNANMTDAQSTPEQPKFFFNEKYAKLGVKGNFMPLAAQPVNVDLADWLAHQSRSLRSVSAFRGPAHDHSSGGELPFSHHHRSLRAGDWSKHQKVHMQYGYLSEDDRRKVPEP